MKKSMPGQDSRDGGGDDRGRRVASGDLGGDRKREEKREGVSSRFCVEGKDANRKAQEEVKKRS